MSSVLTPEQMAEAVMQYAKDHYEEERSLSSWLQALAYDSRSAPGVD